MVPDLPLQIFGCSIPHVTLLQGVHSWCAWEEGREIHTGGVEVDFFLGLKKIVAWASSLLIFMYRLFHLALLP